MTRRLKVGGVVALVGIVVVIGLLALWQWASRPADGSLHTKTPEVTKDLDVFDASAEAVNIQNEYFTASLPAGFTIKRQTDTPQGLTLLQLAANDKRQQLAVTIATLPPDGLTSVGNYNLRNNTDRTNAQS